MSVVVFNVSLRQVVVAEFHQVFRFTGCTLFMGELFEKWKECSGTTSLYS